MHFSVQCVEPPASKEVLDFEECSALRYSAGYIICSLIKKITRSRHQLKQELVLCLREMIQGIYYLYMYNYNYVEFLYVDEEHESIKWTQLLDRGGLIHISDVCYYNMELGFRQNFTITSTETLKTTIPDKVLQNEDLQFYWSLVSVNWSDEVSTALLHMIVNQWITVRGFSSASAFIEMYKKTNKKTFQKSKGLRKSLI